MSKARTGSRNPVLEEAARELEAAAHDARVAVDCVALSELDRAYTRALTARVAADAAVTAPTFRVCRQLPDLGAGAVELPLAGESPALPPPGSTTSQHPKRAGPVAGPPPKAARDISQRSR